MDCLLVAGLFIRKAHCLFNKKFSYSRMLRLADSKGLEDLANLYEKSVLDIGKEKYDYDQVAVWASFANDLGAFSSLIVKDSTILAEFVRFKMEKHLR
jgi:hypothetical protein